MGSIGHFNLSSSLLIVVAFAISTLRCKGKEFLCMGLLVGFLRGSRGNDRRLSRACSVSIAAALQPLPLSHINLMVARERDDKVLTA